MMEAGTLVRQGLGETKGPCTGKAVWERIKHYKEILKESSIAICTICGMGVIGWHDVDKEEYSCYCVNGQCTSKSSGIYKDSMSPLIEKFAREEAVMVGNLNVNRFTKIRMELEIEKRISKGIAI